MHFRSLLNSSLLATTFVLAAPAMAQPPQSVPPPPMVTAPQAAPAQPVDPNAIRGSIQVCEAARGEHRVQLRAGQRYNITATSEAFDPFIRLLRPGSEEAIAEDDDSGGGLVPRITYAPTESGEYLVRVSSFAAGGTGDYALSVTPAAPLPALITRPARSENGRWRIFQGELAATDAQDGESRYDDYELRIEAGKAAMIHVQAAGDELDTQIKIFRVSDRGGGSAQGG
jgi:hypothetical protein